MGGSFLECDIFFYEYTPGAKLKLQYEEIEKIEIAGEKIWQDNDNSDGTRPEAITVKLLQNGEILLDEDGNEIIKEITSDEDGTWKFSFEDLAKYDDNGNEYIYTIEEVPVDGYKTEYEKIYENDKTNETEILTGYTITNIAMIDIPVIKVWNDYENAENTRPTEIKVKLLRNGIDLIDENGNNIIATLSEENNWSCTFEDLEKYDENNELYTYSVAEDIIENYNTEITGNQKDGFTITNTYTTSFDISGTKIWVDYENKYETRPDEITIKLLQNGTEIASKKVTKSDNWNYVFTDLEKYDSENLLYEYTIEEEKIDGYVEAYDENYNIINTLIDGTYNIVLLKQNEDGEILSGVTFTVNEREHQADENGIINVAENQIITINNADSQDLYSIIEKETLDGYKLYDNTITLTVTKKLAESGDKYIIDKAILDEVSASSENISVKLDDDRVTITLINEKEEVVEPEPEPENPEEPNDTNNVVNTNVDNTTAPEILPQTGQKILSFIFLSLAVGIAIILYIKFKTYDDIK